MQERVWKGASDFFLGKRAGDVFRAEQYGGDRDFFLSGGRTPSEVNRMVMSMNDPEQSVSPIGFIGDSISDALDRFGIDTDFFSKDPSEMILETDTVERKRFEEEAQIQEQINNVSDAMKQKKKDSQMMTLQELLLSKLKRIAVTVKAQFKMILQEQRNRLQVKKLQKEILLNLYKVLILFDLQETSVKV